MGICVFIIVVLVVLFPCVVRLVRRIQSLLTCVDRLENTTILHGMVRLGVELARSFQCFGVVFFIVATSATFLNGVDLAVVFLSTLAPVIVTAIAPLITLVAVVAGVVALVAAIKIVVPTTVAAVVVAMWRVVGAWNPCRFFDDYLFSIIGIRIFLGNGQEHCD